MIDHLAAHTISPAVAQQHILDVVAESTSLVGTLDELGAWSGISPTDLRDCLGALCDAGWIAVQTEKAGRLRIRLQRRPRG
jgi:hypothetical protein